MANGGFNSSFGANIMGRLLECADKKGVLFDNLEVTGSDDATVLVIK